MSLVHRVLYPQPIVSLDEYLARGGESQALEGDVEPGRVVILRFESADAARRWYYSDEYSRLREIRQAHSTGDFVLTEGV